MRIRNILSGREPEDITVAWNLTQQDDTLLLVAWWQITYCSTIDPLAPGGPWRVHHG